MSLCGLLLFKPPQVDMKSEQFTYLRKVTGSMISKCIHLDPECFLQRHHSAL